MHSAGRTYTTGTKWIEGKTSKLGDTSQWDNQNMEYSVDGIPEYEEESWDNTELLKDVLHEKLCVNKI